MDDIQFDKYFKNERLRDVIRDALVNGEFRPGDKLPSQNEMCDRFAVSPNTVREAIASLVHEGLLYRVQGKGTFVTDKKPRHLTIGLVVHRLTVQSYTNYRRSSEVSSALLHFVQEEANENDVAVLLYVSNDDPEMERRSLKDLVDRKVDGIILFYTGGEKNLDCLEEVKRAGIPLVLVDRYVEGFETDYVVSDNFSGAVRVVDSLAELGFEKILHYTYLNDSNAVSDRTAGYVAAMTSRGVDCGGMITGFPEQLLPSNIDTFRDNIIASLQQVDGRFAVFTTNSGVLQYLWPFIAETGIPRDQLALACFDYPYPGLPEDVTIVKAIQPLEEIGRRSVRIILDKLNGLDVIQQVKIDTVIEVTTCGGPVSSHSSLSDALSAASVQTF